MGEDQSPGGSEVSGAEDPDQLQREIEATREELGDTVEALTAKTDVKAQAKQKLDDAKSSVSETKDHLMGQAREMSPDSASSAVSQAGQTARQNPVPLAAAGAFLAGFLIGRVSSRANPR